MKRNLLVILGLITAVSVSAQVKFGGYGKTSATVLTKKQGNVSGDSKFSIDELVLTTSYEFDKKTSFISEMQVLDAERITLQQLYLKHKVQDWLQVKSGYILMPVGMFNESHEPTSYNGVQFSLTDNLIIPTNWSEIALGLTGVVEQVNIKYDAYVTSSLSSYTNEEESFVGGNFGLSEMKQNGIGTFKSPSFVTRVEYYGLKGFKVGGSFYYGKTESDLAFNVNSNDSDDERDFKNKLSDSTRVTVAQYGFYTSYDYKGFNLKGQLYVNNIGNATQYNQFRENRLNDYSKIDDRVGKITATEEKIQNELDKIDPDLDKITLFTQQLYKHEALLNQYQGEFNESNFNNRNGGGRRLLGDQMLGAFVELSYDVLHTFDSDKRLVTFFRYDRSNVFNKRNELHAKFDSESQMNSIIQQNKTDYVFGLNYFLTNGAVFKVDYKFETSDNKDFNKQRLGVGLGFTFNR